MSIVGEPEENMLEIEPGEDHCIVMRCNEAFGGISYGV